MPPTPPSETLTLPRPAPVPGLAPGTVIDGKYRLVAPIGAGGMGAVWLAVYTSPLGRSCAVKFLADPAPAARDRFLAEAQIMATLRHPHIVSVLDHGIDALTGLAYLVMDEFLPGPADTLRLCRDLLHCPPPAPLASPAPLSLARLLDGGKTLPEETVLAVARQLLSAVEAAHALSPPVIHRDIKPSNILFAPDGRALLADFGIAKRLSPGETSPTLPGATPGTPAYAAPEQLAGAPVGPAADFYSFGVVLYRALTGGMPFPSPALPADIAPAVSPAWADLFPALLEKDPDKRLVSPARIRALLEHTARPPRLRLRPAFFALPALALALLFALFLLFPRPRPTSPSPTPSDGQPSAGQTATPQPTPRPSEPAPAPLAPTEETAPSIPAPPPSRPLPHKAQIRQYADTLRTLLDRAIDPVPDDTGAIVVPEGHLLLSGDLPHAGGTPPTILLDGGTLLFAPFAAHFRQLLDQTDHYLANAPDGAAPPSFLPIDGMDTCAAPLLIGPSGGRIGLVDEAFTGILTGPVRPADGLSAATLHLSGGPNLILDRAALSPALVLHGTATLADIPPSGPIRNRTPFSSP